MIGRLFKFFVLAGIVFALAYWLLNNRQRSGLHRLFRVMAITLLASACLLSLLYVLRGAMAGA